MADATAQLEVIWNAMSPAVEHQIAATGTFRSFGATYREGSPVEAVVMAAGTSTDEALRAHLRALAGSGRYAAIGMASQVEANVPEQTGPATGILYQFDNAEGVSQATFLPYTVNAAGAIAYGQLHGQEGAHDLFTRP